MTFEDHFPSAAELAWRAINSTRESLLNERFQRALRPVGLCASACLAHGATTESTVTLTFDDMPAEGCQEMNLAGEQQGATATAAPKTEQKSDIGVEVAAMAGHRISLSAATVSPSGKQPDFVRMGATT